MESSPWSKVRFMWTPVWFTIGIKIIQQTCGTAIGDKLRCSNQQTLVLTLTTYRRWFEFGCNKSHTIHMNVESNSPNLLRK